MAKIKKVSSILTGVSGEYFAAAELSWRYMGKREWSGWKKKKKYRYEKIRR